MSTLPDAERARRLDAHMRHSLADSLEHIYTQAAAQIDAKSTHWQRVVHDMRTGVVYPSSTFGWYSELVMALLREDYRHASQCSQALLSEQPLSTTGLLLALDEIESPATRALLQRQMATGTDGVCPFVSPSAQRVTAFIDEYNQACNLLLATDAELGAEINALVSQVILVGDLPDGSLRFDGGSSFMLWGGLFLNVEMQRPTFELAEVIVHEASHLLLYALSSEETLLHNDVTERYPSPLRADLRPMDGIFHATYVLARMHRFLGRLLSTQPLDTASRQAITEAQAQRLSALRAGWHTIEQHGKLTATGAAIFAAIGEYLETCQ